MDPSIKTALPEFMDRLGLDEPPLGLMYSDQAPAEGFAPKPSDLPTREKELAGQIDWQAVFGTFSCAIGHLWRARKKQTAAFFSAERFGCPGASFWMGFNKPQTETIIGYVSSGIPNWTEGEHYCDSPDTLRQIFEFVDPPAAPKKYCVFKPMTQVLEGETPALVMFFARPESLCGLHQLAAFVTNDPEVVVSPWSAGCGSLVAWPQHYLVRGQNKAVIGGWDPSARKFYKTDELSFTTPFPMFVAMIRRHGESFLATKTWRTVQKKIARSKNAWGEGVDRAVTAD
jgi:uncharacterized protein (DUF169 family)